MTIVPTSYHARSYVIRQLGDMRDQLDALQRQMATGRRAETNAALGSERLAAYLAHDHPQAAPQARFETLVGKPLAQFEADWRKAMLQLRAPP